MGEVYKAWDPSLKRHVALKVLPRERIATEEMLRRFAREARAASALNHPNIITVYEIGQAEVGGHAVDFMAMELIEGETLRSFISRQVEMPKALNYLAQTADGLAKAHSAGILHRDLKPENIMITGDGYAKILDFGLAKTSLPESSEGRTGEIESATISLPGAVMGTIGYMSPEQVRGTEIDQRSDIFSLGCILYEVLTRRRPFQGNSSVDTFHKIVYEPPPPIGVVDPPVSDALRRVTLKCLGKDPEERYQSAKEIAIDLREIRREYESGAYSFGALPEKAAPGNNHARAFWIWIAAAVLTLAASSWLWSRFVPGKRETAGGGLESMTVVRLPATTNVERAAISPDGRYIAHAEATSNGDVLMVRQVATGSEIEAAPADGKPYENLSFSPDGEYVRYVHDGAFRQSPALGGSPKVLIDNFSFPVSFSPDGKRCAFVRDGSVFLANSDGSGERRIATSSDGERYILPAWSPRGDVVACVRGSERRVEQGNMWIEILDPGSGAGSVARPSTVLGERWHDISSLTWFADATGIAISATRRGLIDRQLCEITYPEGRTRRLTNDLFEYDGASVTADGNVLVSRQTDRRSSLWRIPVERPENGRKMVEGVGLIRHVTALPDGDVIYAAFGVGNIDIWRMALDGTRRKQLTDSPANDSMPAVSPDGKTVAFISDRSGQVTIWTMGIDGSRQKQLTTGDRDVRPRFAPDGTWLLYNARGGKEPAIHRIPVGGGTPSVIPSKWQRVPAISPDGKYIAALDSELKLGVVSATDGSPVRSFEQRSTAITELRWTKDSRAIAFERADEQQGRVGRTVGVAGQGVVYRQDLGGGPPVPIADVRPDEILSFDWTLDGKSLLMVRVSNQRGVVMLKNFR